MELLKNKPPLVDGAINLEDQLQPNGIDLTVREISSFSSRGNLTETNEGRELSRTTPVLFEEHGGVDLTPGPYLITFNEIVSLPINVLVSIALSGMQVIPAGLSLCWLYIIRMVSGCIRMQGSCSLFFFTLPAVSKRDTAVSINWKISDRPIRRINRK